MYKLPIEKSKGPWKKGKKQNITSSWLMGLDNAIFGYIDAKSGGQVRENPELKQKYEKYIKQNLGESKKQLTQNIHDELENENFHLMNETLAKLGYYPENIARNYRISE